MKAEEKVAGQRVSVIELAENLGDVSEACRDEACAAVSSTSSSAAFRLMAWKDSRLFLPSRSPTP